jgi:hypothetical protein
VWGKAVALPRYQRSTVRPGDMANGTYLRHDNLMPRSSRVAAGKVHSYSIVKQPGLVSLRATSLHSLRELRRLSDLVLERSIADDSTNSWSRSRRRGAC